MRIRLFVYAYSFIRLFVFVYSFIRFSCQIGSGFNCIWAYSQVSTTIRYKETAWKSLCIEKPLFSDILANFGHFRWPNLAETVKRQIYRPRPFIWTYSQVSTTTSYKDTAWKSSCFKKPLFSAILAKFGHFRWPNLAKTVKRTFAFSLCNKVRSRHPLLFHFVTR